MAKKPEKPKIPGPRSPRGSIRCIKCGSFFKTLLDLQNHKCPKE